MKPQTDYPRYAFCNREVVVSLHHDLKFLDVVASERFSLVVVFLTGVSLARCGLSLVASGVLPEFSYVRAERGGRVLDARAIGELAAVL